MRRPVTRNRAPSIHYVSPSGEYDLAVGGTNLTNDRYIMSGQPNFAAGFIDASYNAPREWYVTLRVEMGE
jgi:iron complex outermembrane receptor protein